MRTIAFLLLLAMTVCAAGTPMVTVGPNGPVTADALSREMSVVAVCSADAGAPPFNPLPQTMILDVYVTKHAVAKVSAMTGSGNPAFDRKAISCLQNLPLDFGAKIEGNLIMFVAVRANNGAVVPEPSDAISQPQPMTVSTAPVQHPSAPLGTPPAAPATIPPPPVSPPPGPPGSCAAYYPPIAVRLNQEGDVELAFTIEADGTVKDVFVAKSSGHDELDQAAAHCAALWRYKSATRNGIPVAVQWHTVVRFRLDPSAAPSPEVVALQAAYRKVRLAGFRCIGASLPSDDDLKLATGKTTLLIALNEGAISDVKIYQTSGNGKLDNTAAQCFRSVHINADDAKMLAIARELPIFVDWSPAGIKALSNIAVQDVH